MRAVNLIPVEQRSGQPVGAGRSQGAAYAVLALFAGLAFMAYSYGSADHQISSRQAQSASITRQAQQVQQAAERLAPYASFIAQREERTQAVQTLIDSRFDWAHVFHEFGRVLPTGVSVTSLSGNVGASTEASSSSTSTTATGGGPVNSATPPGTIPTFSLAGCAASQPTVALTLQRLRLIDGVKEVNLENSSGAHPKASSGAGGTTGGGGCPEGDPNFSVQITFAPLPSSTAVAAATKVVSNGTSAGTATPEGSSK
jgi:Tfp pilus assembly protein PilN